MSSLHEIDSLDPIGLFDSWLQQARESEPNDPNAVALATATPDGVPSVRMVLAKRVGGHPFCFFTNGESRKGVELISNPMAALCFHWKSLRRQVRVEGEVSELAASAVDEYFHRRSRASQISAAVSHQSCILGSRAELEDRVREFA
jgi:pyridoxamine 5'-phosphate oxidase